MRQLFRWEEAADLQCGGIFFTPKNEAGGSLAAFSYAVRDVNVGGCSETEHMLKW